MAKRAPETRAAARAPRPAAAAAPSPSARPQAAADVVTEPLPIVPGADAPEADVDESDQNHVNRPRRRSVSSGVDGSGGDPPAGQPRPRGPVPVPATPGVTGAVPVALDDLPDGVVVADADGRVV